LNLHGRLLRVHPRGTFQWFFSFAVLTFTSCVQLVIDEIGPDAATPLQAIKLLAVYLSGGAENKVGYLVPCHFVDTFVDPTSH
jgi:hypothetical protein